MDYNKTHIFPLSLKLKFWQFLGGWIIYWKFFIFDQECFQIRNILLLIINLYISFYYDQAYPKQRNEKENYKK